MTPATAVPPVLATFTRLPYTRAHALAVDLGAPTGIAATPGTSGVHTSHNKLKLGNTNATITP